MGGVRLHFSYDWILRVIKIKNFAYHLLKCRILNYNKDLRPTIPSQVHGPVCQGTLGW